MKRTLGGSTLIGIGLVVALLFVNAALTFRNTKQLDEDARWVAQTHEVLDLTGDVLLTLIDAETGQRGFLITRKDEYLKPYHAALDRWEASMANLKSKTKENARQQDRIRQIETMSADEFALLKRGIEMRRNQAKIQDLLDGANAARKQMDAIRQVVAEMRAEENEQLGDRQERTADAYRIAVATGLLTTALGLFVVVAFVWALRRNLRIRDKGAAAIHEQREWLRTTLSSIGDGVISTDREGKVTLLNVVAQTLTGWSLDDARGQPLEVVFKIINEQTRETVENPVQRVLHTGAIAGLANHTVLIAKDGTERVIDDSAAPIKNDEGKTIGVVMVFRDVTERRRTDETIRQGEARLRMALAATRMLIWEWNPSLNKVVMSEGIADVLGLPATARIEDTEKLFALIHSEDLQQHRAVLQKAIEGCDKYVNQYRVLRPDNGVMIWLEERGQAIRGSSGKTERVIALVMDINDRKRTEEALKEADQRKTEFLAMLAHELRNPLAPIRNALQILRQDGSSGESFTPVREMMDRQVGHMVRLVDDLLDVSRITRGNLELRKARVGMAQVVESALETTRPLVAAAKHELTVSVPSEPLWVDGDLMRLAQVVSNLLSNAIKYTPEGGHIWLTVEGQASEVLLRVRDDGMGISGDMLSKVFEMFTQVDRTMERTQGGLGIGLTLVRRLVQMHGGSVEAQSAGPDQGSEFIVRLPLAEGSSTTAQTGKSDGSTEAVTKSPRRRILVVDDNVDSAESLGLLLEMMGNEVRTAYDGPNALEGAKEFRPDIVLLDIGLPGMNGYDVARRMKLLPEMKDTLLVAQTGWGQDEDRRRSAEAGFDAHLVKPVDPAALQKLLVR